ncbi:MAG: hypothetical protein LUE64_04070, partial [Candidatus Gastranaerophilales bacterium]|nr:hypothetical protein [Candidatus Gastranaerophilales bacterium]
MSFFEGFEYIFSDFDGTISKHDVIHSFINNFAKGDSSLAERQWANGEISTEECMKIQLGLIVDLKKETFFE